MTGVLLRRSKLGHRHTQKGHFYVKMEAETAVMYLETEEAGGVPPEARSWAWSWFPLEHRRERGPADTSSSHFQPPEL